MYTVSEYELTPDGEFSARKEFDSFVEAVKAYKNSITNPFNNTIIYRILIEYYFKIRIIFIHILY